MIYMTIKILMLPNPPMARTDFFRDIPQQLVTRGPPHILNHLIASEIEPIIDLPLTALGLFIRFIGCVVTI